MCVCLISLKFTLCYVNVVLQKSYGEKGKITLKMRKKEPSLWVDRWSPRREETNTHELPANTDNGEHNEPIITHPSDDDSD